MKQIITLVVESEDGVEEPKVDINGKLYIKAKHTPRVDDRITLIDHQIEDQPDTDPSSLKDQNEDNLPCDLTHHKDCGCNECKPVDCDPPCGDPECICACPAPDPIFMDEKHHADGLEGSQKSLDRALDIINGTQGMTIAGKPI